MSRSVTLSRMEYDFLWEYFQLGSHPPILRIESHGHTVDDRAQLRHESWQSLRAKGLGEPGKASSWLADRLAVLAKPRWEVDGLLRLDPHGPPVLVLAASAGTIAVLAVLAHDRLTLTGVEPADLVRAAVSVLPACPPGGGLPVNLPAEHLDAAAEGAGSDPNRLRDRLVARGIRPDDARRVALVLSASHRAGSFGMSHTPPRGKRGRANHVVTFVDAHDGGRLRRYLFTRKPDKGGWWVVLTGADNTKLINEIGRLRRQLINPQPR